MTTTTTTETAIVSTSLDRLSKSLSKGSLSALVSSRRRSLMLVDVSGSMAYRTSKGERKIDALRNVVKTIAETHPVPVAAFGGHSVRLVDEFIPEPHGGTPMDRAINYGQQQGATHLVLVTDGQPGDRYGTLDAARAFGGPIDVFFIGDANDRGAEFAREIARITGGSVNLTDLGEQRQLATKITGLLGDGSN